MKKLASIERILEIGPILGADKIEVATVLGYKTVVKKGEFSKGDFCIFHLPDTVVADKPAYEFLRKQNFRLKLTRLRGQVSQGLALPLSSCPEVMALDIVEGLDVTEAVGIKKYEKPLPKEMVGVAHPMGFPSWLKKTDEDNLLSNIRAMEEFQGLNVIITKKVDGQSGTFALKDNEFFSLSRNLNLLENPDNTFWKIAEAYKIKSRLSLLAYDIAIQGEVYGPGIQGNKTGSDKVKFAAFNLFDIQGQKYYNHDQLEMICKDLGIPVVETIYRGRFDFTIQDLINLANAQTYENGEPCEGIVIRPAEEQESRVLKGRLSVKVISEKFLEKNGE